MEKMLTEEQLNKLDKSALITIILSIANQMAELTEMNKLLKLEVESLSEKLSLSNTRQFAPSSEQGQ